MEQLKPILKYHFWILCGIVVLTTIGAGFWAMSGQASTINKQVGDINSAQNKARSVMSVSADVGEEATVSVHPNENTKVGMEDEIQNGKEEVMAAWQKLYNEQKDLLDWPLDALPEEITRVFDQYKPERMEFELNNEQMEVSEGIRKRVRQILPRVLPKLAEKIRAEWEIEDIESGSDSGEPVATDAENPVNAMMFNQPITTWSIADQEQWKNELTVFKERNGNKDINGTPTTMQVLYAKENLVLLNSVLEILKSANADAMTPGQATVKTIQSILIGRQAHEAKRLDLGALAGDGNAAAGADRTAAMQAYIQNRGNRGKPGGDKSDGSGGTVTAKEADDPAHLRYVNENFEPIKASEYRNSAKATTLSDKSWMSVVKRVPVRLTLKIDERHIDELLEACANAKIPLEVRQVTIIGGDLAKSSADTARQGGGDGKGAQGGPSAAGAGSGPTAAGAGGATMTVNEGGAGGAAGGAGAAGGVGGGSDLDSENYKTAEFNSNFNVPVEIYGFMKIYNEPEPAAIGADPAATETE